MTPEETARHRIDEMLTASGWVVDQDYHAFNRIHCRGIALREGPLESGRCNACFSRTARPSESEMVSKLHEIARRTRDLEYVRFATVALSLADPTWIVAGVERRSSVVEELEAVVVSANLHRATRLGQSVLQQAFSGKNWFTCLPLNTSQYV